MRLYFVFFVLLMSFHSQAKESLLNLDMIRSIIETNRPQSIDEFLEYVPEDYLSHYTLMHTSRSLQSASLEHPRVIVYGKNAKTLMAFTGENKRAADQTIELLVWDKKTSRYEARKISFLADEARGGFRAQLSPKNPRLCMRCHGQQIHPIWDKYDKNWEGSFGEHDDYVSMKYANGKALATFNQNYTNKKRYRHLSQARNITKSLTFPYFNRDDPNQFLGHVGSIDNSPNLAMGEMIGMNHILSLYESAKTSKDFSFNKYVLGWIYACQARMYPLPVEENAQQIFNYFRKSFNESQVTKKYPQNLKVFNIIKKTMEKVPEEHRGGIGQPLAYFSMLTQIFNTHYDDLYLLKASSIPINSRMDYFFEVIDKYFHGLHKGVIYRGGHSAFVHERVMGLVLSDLVKDDPTLSSILQTHPLALTVNLSKFMTYFDHFEYFKESTFLDSMNEFQFGVTYFGERGTGDFVLGKLCPEIEKTILNHLKALN